VLVKHINMPNKEKNGLSICFEFSFFRELELHGSTNIGVVMLNTCTQRDKGPVYLIKLLIDIRASLLNQVFRTAEQVSVALSSNKKLHSSIGRLLRTSFDRK
jgi:hypothetical protein